MILIVQIWNLERDMNTEADRYKGPLSEAGNHYYEKEDAFTRYVPRRMQKRCVEWIEMEDGKKTHLVAGKLNKSVGNPVSKPSLLREYYHGNPRGLTFVELTHSALEPMPQEYMNGDARIDEQGLAAAWLFPTAGILYEQSMIHDIDATCTLFEGFNCWLNDDWGFRYQNKLFAAPYITLADTDFACKTLERALARDARVLVMRPSPICTRDGYFAVSDERTDTFWRALTKQVLP